MTGQDPGLTPFTAEQLLGEVEADADETLLLFAAERSRNELPQLLDDLRSRNVDCAGAVFPEVVLGGSSFAEGFVLTRFPAGKRPVVMERVDDLDFDFGQIPTGIDHRENGTIIVLADADCVRLPMFLKQIYKHFGNRWQYFGAGAGSFMDRGIPCVFSTAGGIQQGAAVLIFVEKNAVIDSRHGWSKAVGPVVATRARGNVIHELNWRPAIEVYRELISGLTDQPLNSDSLEQIGIGFPFGMFKEGAEDLVRLPVEVTESGALVVVGGVPENSVLHILSGTADALIDAAGASAQVCADQLQGKFAQKIVLDCVTRRDFLGDQFSRELQTIQKRLRVVSDQPLIGALTRGEIAMASGGYPEWLNKSTVVGVFE